MVLKVLRFYWECLSRAFSGVFWRVEKWTGGLGVVAAILANFDSVPSGVAQLIEVDLVPYIFIALFLGTALLGFLVAPYQIYAEEREKREAAEFARAPKLSVQVRNGGYDRKEFGETSVTLGGVRQTMLTSVDFSLISVLIKNNGEIPAKNCRARLIAVDECDDPDREAGVEVIEPIDLPWSAVEPEANFSNDLSADEVGRVWIARCNHNGRTYLNRNLRYLSPEYHQIFGPPGIYVFRVQFSSDNSAPVEVKFRLITSPSEKGKNGMAIGSRDLSIIGQGSPRL